MISFDEAVRRVAEAARPLARESVPLAEAAGRVLAAPVAAQVDSPPADGSAMDGYAVRESDLPGPLRMIGESFAGGGFEGALEPGTCVRIFTGAPLPEGADTVVRQEDTDQGAETVTITRDRDVGVNIRRAGEDIRKGATVLRAGTPLGPAELGVLASLAVGSPMVYRRPRVAILGSGDEIVDVDQPEEILSGRKTASSNTHTLLALVRRAGGEPLNLGIARDTPESLRERLQAALEADLLVTTAGISVGEHDYLRGVLEELGAEQRFWKLRMRPGAPVGFGLLQGIPWIGLPGNPVSTMVTFELFVRPAIRKMMGHALPFRRAVPVRLAEPISVKPRLQHFLRAVVNEGDGVPEARLTGPQGSGILTSMVLANALLVVPEGQFETPAGATVMALRLEDPVHREEPGF